MAVKVSVIVPVYNVEQYLDECLASLVAQTLDSLEILVINDGSTDNSQRIVDIYVKQYPDLIRSFIKENGGLGDARNYGIRFAQGEYIGFIDSDDTVEADMYQSMYEKAVEESSDMVLCDLEYFYEDGSSPEMMRAYNPIDGVAMHKAVFMAPLFAWNKLYRRRFFINSGLSYPTGLWYEDIPVTVPLFSLAERISVVSRKFVNYRQRSSSIMGSVNNPKVKDIFVIMKMCLDYFERNEIRAVYEKELEYLWVEHLLINAGQRFMLSDKFADQVKVSLDMLDEYFPRWRKNSYLNILPFRRKFYAKYFQKWMIPGLSVYLKLVHNRKTGS